VVIKLNVENTKLAPMLGSESAEFCLLLKHFVVRQLSTIMKDTYRTLSAPSEGDFKDRGSKFITYAYPVYSETDWQNALTEVRKCIQKHVTFATLIA